MDHRKSQDRLTISCGLQGGLGNQLFQIFTVLALRRRNLKESSRKRQARVILPSILQASPTRSVYWHSFLQAFKKYVKPKSKHKLQLYQERNFHYTALPLNRSLELSGYFQSYLYFHDYRTKLFEKMGLAAMQAEIFNKHSQLLTGPTISLHMRLGDYGNLSQHHPIMPLKYYIQALTTILNTTCNNYRVLCFSDEPEKIESNLDQLRTKFPDLTFVTINLNLQDYQEMLLMSLCNHHIIANSSFSWWAAYFGNYGDQKPDNLVCYPDPWFGPALRQNNTKDLCPDSWLKIEYNQKSTMISENPKNSLTDFRAEPDLVFDLKKIPIYVLTCRMERRAHISQALDGFNVKFVQGITPKELPGMGATRLLCGAVSTAQVLSQALQENPDGRFIVCEDDVSLTPYHKDYTITVPQSAQAVFLGISSCGLTKDRTSNYNTLYGQEISNSNLVRIYNMLSTHAIFFLSVPYIMAHYGALIESATLERIGSSRGWDTYTASLQFKFEIYACKKPYLYQDIKVGGQQEPTLRDNLTFVIPSEADKKEFSKHKKVCLLFNQE